MERERLTPLVVALLAVLALAVGAATLDSATSGSVTGSGEGPGIDDGESPNLDFGSPPPAETPQDHLFPTWLAQLLIVLLFVGGLLSLLLWIRAEGLDFIKKTILAGFALTGLVLLAYYLFQWLASGFDRTAGERGFLGDVRPELPSGGGGSGGGVSEMAQVATEPSAIVFAVFAIVLVGAVAIVLRTASDRADDDPSPEPDASDPTVREVSAAAGRAADRIDATGDVENAVYRAWREMTDPLDLPRETTTPREFATAAVDAGMRRDDVDELTGLFETTRYGGVAVDEDRERRATTALRRIERTYGGER